MSDSIVPHSLVQDPARIEARQAIHPLTFSSSRPSGLGEVYLRDPATRKLVEFFEHKGLAAIKEEDRTESWYVDWLAYQAGHRLYASVLIPREYSVTGGDFDLLRYARFLEVFAYFSPAHGYSLQVTSLGVFSILMGTNAQLKREASAALETGGLLAFGVSERAHGSDLLGNEFTISEIAPDRLVANGAKYYIGNANAAAIVSVLARKEEIRSEGAKPSAGRERRSPFVLFALRPAQSPAMRNVRKIRTFGVRAGFVGEFEVKGHELPTTDLIAEGRAAWDAVFGAVTLGKFFLGFGSIGICERALEEATGHLSRRVLYGKPAIEMPHLRSTMAAAYARLTAMKLYAYRALDYVHAASESDRRYQLFTAVQKARVSTEGVKVMALLSECVGARAFESETYFEMALRDAQLIPSLEGSTHVNLALAARFIHRYFGEPDRSLAEPPSVLARETAGGENPYLFRARTGAVNTIGFADYLAAYRPLLSIANVRRFARQADCFARFVGMLPKASASDPEIAIALGQCLAIVAYAQLIAENATRLGVSTKIVSAIFHLLVIDLSTQALSVAALPQFDPASRALIRRVVAIPKTRSADWETVFKHLRDPAAEAPTPRP